MINKEMIIPEINEKTIESMIYIVRGEKVMLDFELAQIYGYVTKAFNQQVKNNLIKFDIDFRFQLAKDEWNKILMSKKLISSWGGVRRLPYAFTEQGIYMLMTILKGDLAVKQSKILIRTFKQMKDYIVDNKSLLITNEYIKLTNLVNDHSKRLDNIDGKLEIVMGNFIDPSKFKHYLILDGQKIEADIAYQNIYKTAKTSIYVVDDYINVKTLKLLKCCNENINILLITDNKAKNNLNIEFLEDFKKDTGFNIKIVANSKRFHDRYIIIDYKTDNETIYHCGTSSKDAGNKITTIMEIKEKELYEALIETSLNNEELIL